MTMFSCNRRAPKIMLEQINPGCMRLQILIVNHSADIIKNESTRQTVQVDQKTKNHQLDLMSRILNLPRFLFQLSKTRHDLSVKMAP